MFRFPNAATDINGFLHTFRVIYPALYIQPRFGIDGIKQALADNSRISAGGYVGQAGVDRAYNSDRKRDGPYNGAKLYAELYRQLGWFQSAGKALISQISWFGAQASNSSDASSKLMKQALLGLVTPNRVLKKQSEHQLRPFAAILRTAGSLGGMISRDEMIIGPLSLANDMDADEFAAMVQRIQGLRGGVGLLNEALSELASGLNVEANSLRNYTRFPIAALKWTGWFVPKADAPSYLMLTDTGRAVLELISASWDIRLYHEQDFDPTVKEALIKTGFYQVLQRADFDVSSEQDDYEQALAVVENYLGESRPTLLFSPFQELSPAELAPFFPNVHASAEADTQSLLSNVSSESSPVLGLYHQIGAASTTVGFASGGSGVQAADNPVIQEFRDAQQAAGSIAGAINVLFDKYQQANKGVFYNLVGNLFKALGYDCYVPTAGIHADRADATLLDPVDAIPIEIKSPGEEDILSIKAVRQAVENKVILLSRRTRNTTLSSTSLVVGNKLPGNRGEIAALIQDFEYAYGIRVGVIDFRSLLTLVARTALNNEIHDRQALTTLLSFINVDPI